MNFFRLINKFLNAIKYMKSFKISQHVMKIYYAFQNIIEVILEYVKLHLHTKFLKVNKYAFYS